MNVKYSSTLLQSKLSMLYAFSIIFINTDGLKMTRINPLFQYPQSSFWVTQWELNAATDPEKMMLDCHS